MGMLLVQHTVKDYRKWRRAYDDHAATPARRRARLVLSIRTVITGLTPMRTTREECGASAAWRGVTNPRGSRRIARFPQRKSCGEFWFFPLLTMM